MCEYVLTSELLGCLYPGRTAMDFEESQAVENWSEVGADNKEIHKAKL